MVAVGCCLVEVAPLVAEAVPLSVEMVAVGFSLVAVVPLVTVCNKMVK